MKTYRRVNRRVPFPGPDAGLIIISQKISLRCGNPPVLSASTRE